MKLTADRDDVNRRVLIAWRGSGSVSVQKSRWQNCWSVSRPIALHAVHGIRITPDARRISTTSPAATAARLAAIRATPERRAKW